MILGIDVPKFASKGDRIWEVRYILMNGELRVIAWINPKTADVYFVIGPWIADEKKSNEGKQGIREIRGTQYLITLDD